MTNSPIPVIGIVGGIGSGKSTVARWVAARHPVVVIDADALGHEALRSMAIQARLRAAFGDEIFAADGSINRRSLAARIFGDTPEKQHARAKLEGIVHPEIRRMTQEQITAVDPLTTVAVLLDAAILLEAGWADVCAAIVFVDTDRNLRERWIHEQRRWSAEELDRREASQWPLDRKRSAATDVIENRGDPDTAGAALWEIVQRVARGAGLQQRMQGW